MALKAADPARPILREAVLAQSAHLCMERMRAAGSADDAAWHAIGTLIDAVMRGVPPTTRTGATNAATNTATITAATTTAAATNTAAEAMPAGAPGAPAAAFMGPVMGLLSEVVASGAGGVEASHLMARLVTRHGLSACASADVRATCVRGGLTLASVVADLIAAETNPSQSPAAARPGSPGNPDTSGEVPGSRKVAGSTTPADGTEPDTRGGGSELQRQSQGAHTAARLALLTSLLKGDARPGDALAAELLRQCLEAGGQSQEAVGAALRRALPWSVPSGVDSGVVASAVSIVAVHGRVEAAGVRADWGKVARSAWLVRSLLEGAF